MKDSYSLDADEAGLDASYRLHHAAYTRIFDRLGLPTVVVGADVGIMGGSLAHEFMVLNEHGEDTLVLCDACGYAANQQIARVASPVAPAGGASSPRRRSRRPRRTPSPSLAALLGVPPIAPPRPRSSSPATGA